MPKYTVLRDTIDSATGRIYKAGETWEFDPPMLTERDIEGRPILGPDGKPKMKQMTVSGNLELIEAEKPKK